MENLSLSRIGRCAPRPSSSSSSKCRETWTPRHSKASVTTMLRSEMPSTRTSTSSYCRRWQNLTIRWKYWQKRKIWLVKSKIPCSVSKRSGRARVGNSQRYPPTLMTSSLRSATLRKWLRSWEITNTSMMRSTTWTRSLMTMKTLNCSLSTASSRCWTSWGWS